MVVGYSAWTAPRSNGESMILPSRWYVAGLLESTAIGILRDARHDNPDSWMGPTAIADKLGLQGVWRGPAALCVLEMLECEDKVEARTQPNGRRAWRLKTDHTPPAE